MKYFIPVLLFLFLFNYQAIAQEDIDSQKYELRSVWIATATGIDYPNDIRPGEQDLRDMIKRIKDLGMNSVIFQVVARGDAHHQSERLPWARRLTGTFGEDPGYDPLAVVIEESRKLGLEVHAWYNLGRVGETIDTVNTRDVEPAHIYHSNPEWVKVHEGDVLLNPGIPAAREWSVQNVMEIVDNYDIDAIHFDFVRYFVPYDDDAETMAQYNENNIANINDWRRDNISQFMRDVYEAVNDAKPHVKVGSTPVGHYKASGGWAAGYGYSQYFSDSRRWLEEGVNDYLAPQLYWGGEDAPQFDWLAHDWMNESYGRHIYVGHAPYKGSVRSVLPEQIDTLRAVNAHGHVQFSYRDLSDDLFADRYDNPALVPTMGWKGTFRPPVPVNLTQEVDGSEVRLNWEKPTYGTETDTLLRYAIYRVNAPEAPDAGDVIADPRNLLAVEGVTHFTDTPENSEDPYHYYVTSLNRNYVESRTAEASVVTSVRDIDDQLARSFRLEQNYPNPFNPTTEIQFSMANEGMAALTVYDMLGREVAVLLNDRLSAGSHSVRFDAGNLPSGMYIYTLNSGGQTISNKMMLLK